ncbi:hypothetical protein HDU92_001868 [Lobulomyces angularis]|nr:hypothetical protein HDU92_001868 [Lobulomyces angularis]
MNVQSNNTATVIDPTKLKSHKNDILYRFNYVRDFLDFNENDIKAIKLSATILAPLVPQIVDLVYQKLFSFDVTKQIFLQRNEGFTGNIEKNLSSLNLSSDVIKFRKDMLSKYLVKLVTADYDEKFVNYLDWVGRIHTNTPLKKSKINVDYVHVNALFGFVSSALFQIVLDSNLSKKEQDSIVVAFNKLLWIQNGIAS